MLGSSVVTRDVTVRGGGSGVRPALAGGAVVATLRFVSGGQQVAHSGSTGCSPRPTLTTTPGMLLRQRVFLLWPEVVIRGRSNDASGARFGDGGGGGGD